MSVNSSSLPSRGGVAGLLDAARRVFAFSAGRSSAMSPVLAPQSRPAAPRAAIQQPASVQARKAAALKVADDAALPGSKPATAPPPAPLPRRPRRFFAFFRRKSRGGAGAKAQRNIGEVRKLAAAGFTRGDIARRTSLSHDTVALLLHLPATDAVETAGRGSFFRTSHSRPAA